MTKNFISKLFVVVMLSLTSVFAFGQPGDPNEDPQVPISGIGMLLAAGAAFGAKKAYDIYHRKKGR